MLVLIFLSLIFTSGCIPTQAELNKSKMEIESVKKELSLLKADLGDYRYSGIDPQISFLIENVKFKAAKSPFGTATVKFRINMKQNNQALKIKTYQISILVSVLNGSGREVIDFMHSSNMENGALSLDISHNLYSLKQQYDLEGYSLKVKKYYWGLFCEYKPYQLSQ